MEFHYYVVNDCISSIPRDLSESKVPVTPSFKPCLHMQSCLIFQSTLRSQERSDIFVKKSMSLLQRLHAVLLHSYRVLVAVSLHSQSVHVLKVQ